MARKILFISNDNGDFRRQQGLIRTAFIYEDLVFEIDDGQIVAATPKALWEETVPGDVLFDFLKNALGAPEAVMLRSKFDTGESAFEIFTDVWKLGETIEEFQIRMLGLFDMRSEEFIKRIALEFQFTGRFLQE